MTAARQDGGAGMTEAQRRLLLLFPADGAWINFRVKDRAMVGWNDIDPLIEKGLIEWSWTDMHLTPAGIAARARIGGE